MKTTLDLPAALMREIELRAAREGRDIQDYVVELLAAELSPVGDLPLPNTQFVAKRLPCIKARRAAPADAASLTQQEWCDWLRDIEQQHELERYERVFGHQYVDRTDG